MKLRKYTVIQSELIYRGRSVHIKPGKTSKVISYPVLLIADENEEGFYLYRYDSNNNFIGDTLHDDYDELIDQIEYEVGNIPEVWTHLPQNTNKVIESAFNHFNMSKGEYSIKYMHDYATTSLWSNNEFSNKKYGYAIKLIELPISITLINELEELAEYFYSLLDQSYPPDTVITDEFKDKSKIIFEHVKEELGDKYELIDLTKYNN